jgi:hypothetical protein
MFLIFLVSPAGSPDATSDAQSLRAAASQSMKWVTENLDAEAMIVSRRKLRRGLFAEDVSLREVISQRDQFEAMHDC